MCFNRIKYIIYKRCPGLVKILHQIFVRVWTKKNIPISWRFARIKLLAKSADTSHPSLMRPISVLNVEGRIFFTIYQRRISA